MTDPDSSGVAPGPPNPVVFDERAEAEPSRTGRHAGGLALAATVAALVLAVSSPVIVRGGLLADEYIICLRPINEGGYGDYLRHIWEDTGVVRPARFVELWLIATTCTTVPYGLSILVPLALKFGAGLLLLGLLRDMRVPEPWPAIGLTIWLLEPVGTEAALWPAALHVNLGLAFAVAALRLYRRHRPGLAVAASLGAALSVEQAIFALPLAVWLTARREDRAHMAWVAAAAMAIVVFAYAMWPGDNERQALTLADRWRAVLAKPEWYLFFPMAGIGLYSGALGFVWALPFSLAVVAAGALVGATLLPRLVRGSVAPPVRRSEVLSGAFLVAILLGLVNLPLIVTEVGYSARTFTPSWLVIAAVGAIAGARAPLERWRSVGALAGTFAAFAFLSLALSVWVRVETDRFNRRAADWIAARTEDGAVVAVCDVDRTAVTPAPLGAFHLHEFHSTWGSWIEYHTGRKVEIRRSGERYWGARCPDLTDADLVIQFPDLVAELIPGGRR